MSREEMIEYILQTVPSADDYSLVEIFEFLQQMEY